jgi:hypothetical protein
MFQRWFAAASLAVLGACAVQQAVDTFAAPEADFPGKKSFAWQGGDIVLSRQTPPDVVASALARIREAVVEELELKGFVETADAATADMLVSVQVNVLRRAVEPEGRVGAPLPSQVLTASGPPTPAASELPRERTVREGTIVVFVEDPASGRVGWRGLVNVEGRVSSNEAAIRQAAQIARQITTQFPARRTGP